MGLISNKMLYLGVAATSRALSRRHWCKRKSATHKGARAHIGVLNVEGFYAGLISFLLYLVDIGFVKIEQRLC